MLAWRLGMYYLRWSILSDHDGRSKMTTTEAEEAAPFIAVDGRALRFGPGFISLQPIFVEVGEEYGGEGCCFCVLVAFCSLIVRSR